MNQRLTVTLVGSEYPINVGHVARLLKNFGVKKLYLVEPRVDLNIASIYASHGAEVVKNAETIGFHDLRKRHELLVATTAIRATKRANVARAVTPLKDVVKYARAAESVSLVFGRDTTGLRNDELTGCDMVTTIDTGTEYRTMNVSHAVAVMLYLLSREERPGLRLRAPQIRDAFAGYLYDLALASGLHSRRAERLREMSTKIALRSGLSDKELAVLVGLIRRALLTIERGDKAAAQTRSKT